LLAAALSAAVFVVSLVAVAAAGLGVYSSYVSELPSAEEISRRSQETFETTRIYDRTGQHLLYEIIPTVGGRRTWVSLNEIPAFLRNGTIAVEDKTFYTNPGGINIEGFLRAARGVITGEYAGGGSSIHQQLVRNVIMTPEERMEYSYSRKIKEMVLSLELTRQHPGMEGRDQILEWYLNYIFYGHLAYGVEAAAQTYFNKHVSDLSLAEAAMLIPLPNAPTLNPIDNPTEAKKRQEVVLDQLYVQGYISAEEAWAAKQQSLVISPPGFDIEAPHWVLFVRDQLVERYGADAVYGGGLQVITTIDMDIQAQVEQIARRQITELEAEYNAHNAAVVVMDTKTAEIVSMVGSLDYHDETIDGEINMAITPRQPGSSFKPFTYATAFAQGFTPATMVMDVRTSFPDPPNPAPYVPENYSRNFHGPMLLRNALACSFNIPAVAVANAVGTPKIVETTRSMGITTLNNAHYGLSLTLGGAEVPLIEMVYGYSVFANGGAMLGEPVPAERAMPGQRRLDPVSILKVTDAKEKVLYAFDGPQRQEVLRPEVAYLITDILSDNQARTPAFGPDSFLKLQDRPAAAKTGTTNDYHDGWTLGYTPQYVVGVWVGNTDYTPMERASGSRAGSPIWNAVMVYLHQDLPVEAFVKPDGLVTAIVDGTSGKLPTEFSPWRKQEIFIDGTVPTAYDDIHRGVRICRASGKMATVHCPADQVETVVFEVYPPEADDWVREQNKPQPPAEVCDLHGPNLANADVAITYPRQFGIVGGMVTVRGNIRRGGTWRLEYGEGLSPAQWQSVGGDRGNQVNNADIEYWNTAGLSGLYTLRLSSADGGWESANVQVLVDNSTPAVTIVAPEPDQVFTMDKDEWINIQVDAVDDMSMHKVEFYFDDRLLGYSTVAPYTLRWTMAMSGSAGSASLRPSGTYSQTVGTQTITTEYSWADNQLVTRRTIQEGDLISVTETIEPPPTDPTRVVLPDGRGVIRDSGGYTETHTIHVKAYDAAGNVIKSDSVEVQVIPKPPEDKDKPQSLGGPLPIWRRPGANGLPVA
jgi:penicillin-binding protein 1C